MNMRIMDAHNALGAIKFFHGKESQVKKLVVILNEFTEEDWETAKYELPEDYPLMREYQKQLGGKKVD